MNAPTDPTDPTDPSAALAAIDPKVLAQLTPEHLKMLIWQRKWTLTRRDKQTPPPGDWTEWGILAGRGFGKTLTGAQWLGYQAFMDREALPRAVIAPTLNDVRYTCFEGPAGLMSIIPPDLIADYNKTNLILTLKTPFGLATIRGFSAEEPERMRGPQFADLWCFIAGTQVSTPDGQKPIEQLAFGDWVMTRKGARRVVANSKRLADTGTVTFSNGAKLVGTADHPVYTNSGWTRLDQLSVGDLVCAISANLGAANSGIAMAMDPAATTSAPTNLRSPSARCDFTAKYGPLSLGLSSRSTTSTTSITTGPTTLSRIWSACQKALTDGTTLLRNPLLAKIGRSKNRGYFSALTATQSYGASASHASPSAPRATASAPKPSAASPNTADSATLLLSRAPETFAVSVASTWQPAAAQFVYCLKVEGEPEYFANGILVHNCDELAAWTQGEETWDMAMMGLRLGPHPRVVWTTTPKPKDLVRKLVEPKAGRVITSGSTYENKANLPDSFFKQLVQYEGTQLGRQELNGELIDAEEGGIIQRSWLKLWPAEKPLPTLEWIIMSMDTAFTEKTINKRTFDADDSACTVWGVFQHDGRRNVMLLDCWAEQYGMPDLIKRVKKEMNVAYGDDEDKALIKPLIGPSKMASSGRKPDILLLEDKGSGISLRQMLDREGITAYAYNPGRADKLTRLHMVSHIFARGQVWLPESEKHKGRPKSWIEPMLAQLCSFSGPKSIKHDDYVDCVSQCLRLCMDKNLLSDVKQVKRREQETPPPPRVTANPYTA